MDRYFLSLTGLKDNWHHTSLTEICSRNVEGITHGSVMRIRLEENTSDICTKNVDVATFKYHKEEIDNGFLRLRQKIFYSNTVKKLGDQKLLGGMLCNETGDGGTKDDT